MQPIMNSFHFEGRDPLTGGLNLENANVAMSSSGKIVVDDSDASSTAGIFAIGDVALVSTSMI